MNWDTMGYYGRQWKRAHAHAALPPVANAD